MSTIFLWQYARASKILQYDLNTGDYQELDRNQLDLPDTALWRGFYTRVNGAIFGLHASKKGPVLFNHHQHFLLTKQETRSELELGSDNNLFRVYSGDTQLVSILYPRVPESSYGFDNWTANEEDADFFMWLHNSIDKDSHRFYTWHTLGQMDDDEQDR